MVSVYADGDAQEISGVTASTGEWSDADVFEFIDMATAGGDPTYDGNGRMLRQIVHGFWFTGSGESVEELADRRGQLFQFTTGDAGTIHFELFMDWIDVASREGVWMRTDLTVDVVDPTASASSASDAIVVDGGSTPHMGFDAQFGSALVAALLATGGTEPEFALADLDGDGDADLADFAMFQAAFGTTGGTRYTWNTENRLTGVEPLAPSAGDVKVQFAYDHMGRRVLKRVWTYTAGSWGNPTAETKYVYDGWRVIMELDGLNSDAVTRKFTWGLDLSGSVEGAGGIGGLLATEDTAGTTVTTDDRTFIYLYELNGNVGQLVETTTGTDYGTIAAKYEYDPYGKRINTATQGEYDQPYRFSTKPVDDETGLGYWIKRYYSYDLGRWVSRDPIGERGGLNLYTYVLNRPLSRFDIIGLSGASVGMMPVIRAHAKVWERDLIWDDLEIHLYMDVTASCDECGNARYHGTGGPKVIKSNWDNAFPGNVIVNNAYSPDGKRRELDIIWSDAGALEGDMPAIEYLASGGVLIGGAAGFFLPDTPMLDLATFGGLVGTLLGLPLEALDIEAAWSFSWKFRVKCIGGKPWVISATDNGPRTKWKTNEWIGDREPEYVTDP